MRVDGRRVFRVSLSVEKETSAHRTLQLRSFFRQFDVPPDEYYAYVAGQLAHEKMVAAHPNEWRRATEEALQLELGSAAAAKRIDPIIGAIRRQARGNAILLGGPPCQAYSLVGRARNRGVEGYEASKDQRHFLYREYIRIIEELQPAVFVMENVKGILSSKVGNSPIFEMIKRDLCAAGGKDGSYELFSLATESRVSGNSFVVRSELHGVPQRRHRVIILGVRSDLVPRLGVDRASKFALTPGEPVTLEGAIGDMAHLRSGLSKAQDSWQSWSQCAIQAFELAARSCGTRQPKISESLKRAIRDLRSGTIELPRTSSLMSKPGHKGLRAWLSDKRLAKLPNHETRSHMKSDLARYAFAAAFAETNERSPKADEFPIGLAPNHENWESGKFADRFRVQCWHEPSTTITSHISKDGHYYIHPDVLQCRSLTVREAARLQTFPDNYFFEGNRSQQYVQVGNAVPPLLANQIAEVVLRLLS